MTYQVRVNDRGNVKLFSFASREEAELKASEYPKMPGLTVNVLEISEEKK